MTEEARGNEEKANGDAAIARRGDEEGKNGASMVPEAALICCVSTSSSFQFVPLSKAELTE